MTGDAVLPSLAGRELAGSGFVVVEWDAPVSLDADGRPTWIAPLHLHRSDDEAWYVVEGALGFSFDGVEHVVAAGGGALAVAGVVHTYWNAASTPTRYLIITTPRVRELIAVLHDPARRGDRTTDQVFADHDSALVPVAPTVPPTVLPNDRDRPPAPQEGTP